MGDEVIYLRQGHELYVEAVLRDEVYKIDAQRGLPWHKRPNLRVGDLLPRPVASKSVIVEDCLIASGNGAVESDGHQVRVQAWCERRASRLSQALCDRPRYESACRLEHNYQVRIGSCNF